MYYRCIGAGKEIILKLCLEKQDNVYNMSSVPIRTAILKYMPTKVIDLKT